MNDFYNKKAAIPREARNAANLKEALSAWVEKRLLHVVKSNELSDDKYRSDFSNSHKHYASLMTMMINLVSEDKIDKAALEFLNILDQEFQSEYTPGRMAASGICGAELEKIINTFDRNSKT